MATLAFFSVYLLQFSNILILNGVFYIYVLIIGIKTDSLYRDMMILRQIWFPVLIFLGVCVVSTLSYSLTGEFETDVSARVIVQLLFTMQYIIWAVKFNFNWKRFERIFVQVALLLACVLIIVFIVRGLYRNISLLYVSPELRLWAREFIPQWPNTAALPLLLALFICLRKRISWWKVGVISLGLLLSTSRGALLGLCCIYAYFLVRVNRWKISSCRVIILSIVFASVAGLVVLYLLQINPQLLSRLMLFEDRQNIFNNAIGFMVDRPILGYGGRTIDQVDPALAEAGYSHLHNWFLETIFRYGIIGLVSFVYVLVCIYRTLEDNDSKFFFIFLLFLSLFQTFLRNFVVVFYIVYLINHSGEDGHVLVYPRNATARITYDTETSG